LAGQLESTSWSLKTTVANIEIKKPSGKWEKISGAG
jgi:hypothetical protein